MLASAAVSSFGSLLLVRLFLGGVTAAAGPAVASLVGDYFPAGERGKIYGYILSGELIGAGVGFVITGDVSALSWRAAFVVLALPAFGLAWLVAGLPEPARGGASRLNPGAARIIGRGQFGKQRRSEGSEETAVPWPPQPGLEAESEEKVEATDAQQVAQQRGIEADPNLVLRRDPRTMRIGPVVRYVLSIRTNVILVVSSACAYFFLAGVETFGLEFARGQYRVGQVVASMLMLVVGGGAVVGVLVGGRVGDSLVRRGHLNGRITVSGVAALLTVALFVPALVTSSLLTAIPYVTAAAFFLTAQNPPLDAARLDIMPPLLWGRAEGIRTFLRTGAQALAPLLFGGLSDLLGGGHGGLRTTFIIMLAPLTASGVILLRARRTYPSDVATAAASTAFTPSSAAPRRGSGRRRWSGLA
jgi:MFS family permease